MRVRPLRPLGPKADTVAMMDARKKPQGEVLYSYITWVHCTRLGLSSQCILYARGHGACKPEFPVHELTVHDHAPYPPLLELPMHGPAP